MYICRDIYKFCFIYIIYVFDLYIYIYIYISAFRNTWITLYESILYKIALQESIVHQQKEKLTKIFIF